MQAVAGHVANVADDAPVWDAEAALRRSEATRKHREGEVGSFTPRPFRPAVDEFEGDLPNGGHGTIVYKGVDIDFRSPVDVFRRGDKVSFNLVPDRADPRLPVAVRVVLLGA